MVTFLPLWFLLPYYIFWKDSVFASCSFFGRSQFSCIVLSKWAMHLLREPNINYLLLLFLWNLFIMFVFSGTSKNVPVVVEFGSFVMDLFSTTSDLDLSVNFSSSGVDFPREKKIQTLRKFAKKLYALQSMISSLLFLPVLLIYCFIVLPTTSCLSCQLHGNSSLISP